MKKHLFFVIGLVCVMLTAGCATLTPEERAAREAEVREAVKEALVSQKFKLNITSVKPMRGVDRSLSGPWLKVDSTMMECWLPYVGLDDIPHLKTPGEARLSSKLEMKSPMKDYVLAFDPNEMRTVIRFKADDHSFEVKFLIVIDEFGVAKLHVEPEGRDFIDYEGRLNIQKKK